MSDAALLFVPVLRDQKLRAWPKHPQGGRVEYRPLSEALTAEYLTDAHVAAYSVPTIERRLALDTLRLPEAAQLADGVLMVLFVADVDCPAAHGGDPAATDSWWIGQLKRIAALLEHHPGGFVYRTRGGYRIVYVLAVPVILLTAADADAWSLRYCTWLAYLKRAFGIVADTACKDWTRLFRLPHATRDEGGSPEQREVVGDPGAIGPWVCEPSDADDREAAKFVKRKAKRRVVASEKRPAPAPCVGVLHRLFEAAGLLGGELRPGVHTAICPNEAAHTKGERHDGSTVLFPPGAGEIFGHVHCFHGHCQQQTLASVLKHFDPVRVTAVRKEVASVARAERDQAETEAQAAHAASNITVLVPGKHFMPDGREVEVGTQDYAREVLAALPASALYRMDFVVGQIVGEPGERRFSELDDTATRLLVDTHTRGVRFVVTRGAVVEKYVTCSRDLGGLVLSAAAASPQVRQLRQITRFPTYLRGFVLAVPGWNAAAGVYYDEPPELVGLTPRIGATLGVLDDLVIDWPFRDVASRHNTYGLMLSLIVRAAVEGPVPLHFVMASLERTGKGKLIDTVLGYAIQGRAVELIQLGTDEAEREKRITSLLLRGGASIHVDNLSQSEKLDSASLASLATAYPTWGGRILGVSKTPQLPNTPVWVASGNNVQASGELVKRSVPIHLQPRDAHPELRTGFIHEDPFAFALASRREVLEVLLGIVEAWKAAGQPGCDTRMGGFERWVAVVGGCLQLAGATEWMANYVEWITTADDMQVDCEVLVDAWAARHEGAVVTAAEILSLVEATGAFRWVLTKPTAEGRLVVLGRKVLGPLVNRPVKGWIVRRSRSGSSAAYFLERGQA